MSVNVYWDNESKTILRFVCDGHLTWDDLTGALDTGFALMRSTLHVVNVIIDFRFALSIQDGSPRAFVRRAFNEAPANAGNVVFVFQPGGNSLTDEISLTATLRANLNAAERAAVTGSLERARRLLAARPGSDMASQAMT